jgi:hypothetical protein
LFRFVDGTILVGLFPLSDVNDTETWTIAGTQVTVPKVVICSPVASTTQWIQAIDSVSFGSVISLDTTLSLSLILENIIESLLIDNELSLRQKDEA